MFCRFLSYIYICYTQKLGLTVDGEVELVFFFDEKSDMGTGRGKKRDKGRGKTRINCEGERRRHGGSGHRQRLSLTDEIYYCTLKLVL